MSNQKNELPTITIAYKDLNHPKLYDVLHRLKKTELEPVGACRVRKIIQQVVPAIITMEKEFREKIQAPYRAQLESLGIDLTKPKPEEKDLSPETLAKLKEFDAAFEMEIAKFGETEVTFNLIPIGPTHLVGHIVMPNGTREAFKISSDEINSLGPLFDEEGKIRRQYFQDKFSVVPQAPTA